MIRPTQFGGPAVIVVWMMLVISCVLPSACARRQDTNAEETAIVALLNEESQRAIEGDIDGLLSLYVQDEKNARLSITKNVSAMIAGWDAIRAHQMNLLKSDWMGWEEKKFSKENLWVKVNGDNAWAICDNIWWWREGDQRKQFQNIQITICEKHHGRWQIAFQAFVRDPEHLDVVDVQ